MLIAKTLRSSTFKVALICIAGFGAVVIALLGFVYSSTASYVFNQSDRAIDADHAILIAAYQHGGRDELIATLRGRFAKWLESLRTALAEALPDVTVGADA